MKSDDPRLNLLVPSLRESAQQEDLFLLVTEWRLQFTLEESDGKVKELKKLHVSSIVPKDFAEDYSVIDIRIYAVVQDVGNDENDPAPVGRVYSDGPKPEDELEKLTIAVTTTVSTFNDLVSCLQGKVEDTHNFAIHVTTKYSLEELQERGFIALTEIIFDFYNKASD